MRFVRMPLEFVPVVKNAFAVYEVCNIGLLGPIGRLLRFAHNSIECRAYVHQYVSDDDHFLC